MAFEKKIIFLDDDDVSTHLDALSEAASAAGINKLPLYAAQTTIIVGKSGTNYVAKNFQIHEDLLINLFDSCSLETLGLTTTNTVYLGRKSTAAAATPKRTDQATIITFDKGKSGNAPAGRKIKFPIPSASTAGLREFFNKPATSRKFATLIFPPIATLPQIAMWFLTHLPAAKRDAIPFFWTDKGSKVIMPSYPADLAAFDKQVGEFSTTAKANQSDTETEEQKP